MENTACKYTSMLLGLLPYVDLEDVNEILNTLWRKQKKVEMACCSMLRE